MIDTITTTMRQDLVNEITKNIKKIAIIIDEATSNAKDSCLVVYIRSNINGSAVNIFLSIIELSGQDTNSICKSLLDLLESNGIDVVQVLGKKFNCIYQRWRFGDDGGNQRCWNDS